MDSQTYLGEKITAGGRLAVPYTLMIILFALNIVALPYPMSGTIKAPLTLMTLYYWSIYRPSLLPPVLVFLAGLAMDFLSGVPVGLNAALLVALRWFVSDQRRFLTGQPFIVIWLGFSILNLLAEIVQWAIFGLTALSWPPIADFLPSVFLGFALFPAVCMLLSLTYKVLPEQDRAFGRKD